MLKHAPARLLQFARQIKRVSFWILRNEVQGRCSSRKLLESKVQEGFAHPHQLDVFLSFCLDFQMCAQSKSMHKRFDETIKPAASSPWKSRQSFRPIATSKVWLKVVMRLWSADIYKQCLPCSHWISTANERKGLCLSDASVSMLLCLLTSGLTLLCTLALFSTCG